ncbi:hypothetical protein GCM10027176_17710 [Actinoallomurus bryophytorum]|uniref:Uncharacterized protein n=1 Tax=Actinoallomurus bryophytorum TaxID=1490222 RepID=A0A543CLV0_9ACTN|nr:hypothetical protein [Actinoallomurus bryophytorum]TQL97940.1 hypothetical protein FB559_3551 [Actinoallomurus bryophytorum]
MPDAPLQVNVSTGLRRATVSMDEVVEQLAQLRSLVAQDCHLPSLALGVVGAPACARYNGGCTNAGDQIAALHTEADTMVEALGRTAVGYVSAEVANVQAVEQAAETEGPAAAASGGRTAEITATGVLSASWLARFGVRYAQARQLAEATGDMRSVSAELDTALGQATKVWQAERDLDFAKNFMHPGDAVLAETKFNEYGESGLDKFVLGTLEKQIAAADRVSLLARLSQQTESILRMTGSFSVAALAASALWTANAVIMSDDVIDTAIGAWYGAAAGARTIFSEWLPAIRTSLFPTWTGTASTAAEKRFAAFITGGMAFADQAERMASSLTSVVRRLNEAYWGAMAFTTAQFGAMIALSMVAWINPEAEMLLQYLGWTLRGSVTIAINAILALLGGLFAWTAA